MPFASATRFLGVRGSRDVVPFLTQDFVDQSPNVGFVIDYQNSRAHARSLLWSWRRRERLPAHVDCDRDEYTDLGSALLTVARVDLAAVLLDELLDDREA